MASRLAEIYRSEKKTGGGLASSIGKSLKEKIDPRQMLDQSGLLVSMFPSLKSFNATRGKGVAEKVSSNVGGGIDNSVLNTLAATSSLTAKNTMTLPMMARDMNLMKLNIFKLVKLQGGSANTGKTDIFFKNAKDRETAYENTIGKIAGKGMIGKMAKSAFVGKQNRDGQSPESALFVTGGTAGDETSLIGGIVESMGKSATLARLVTVASSVVTSPLFLASAGVLATVALAKKLRDDELASNPEKYKNVPSNRAATEGTTNKTAGARNAAEARAGSLTQGDADGIIKTLIKEKMFGISAENFIREYYPKNPEITLQTILNVCDPKLKEEYQKILAVNMPSAPPAPTPTVLPASPAGAGRGLVNPENVSSTSQTTEGYGVDEKGATPVPSNVIRSGSGAPIMTGSGGYVTSGEASTTPSPMSSTATSSGTSPKSIPSGASGGSTSSYIQKASEMIVKEEGLPKGGKAYFDPPGQKKLVSIGYGHQIKDSEYNSGFIQAGNESIPISGERGIDTVLSKTQSQKLLEMDLPKYEKAAAAPLGEAWSKLNDEQKASLISYAYNTGGTASLVKQGLKDAIMAGDFSKAGNIISQKGIRTAGGVENATLVKRRQHEGALFASSGSPSVAPSSPSSGTAVASTSTSVADAKMAAMTPTGGNTNVTNKPTNVASNTPSSSGKASTAYDNELFQTLVGLQSVSA